MPLFALDELAGRRDRSQRSAADARLCVAAAGQGGRSRSHRQAREPHADRIVQGSRRACLCRCAPSRRAAAQGTGHRDPRQSWPVGCRRRRRATASRRSIVVPEGNSSEKNAAMAAFGGEVVTGGKDFDESRGVAAGDPAPARLSFRAVVSSRTGEGRRDLCPRIVRKPCRSRCGLCADRHGFGNLRADHGARSARA